MTSIYVSFYTTLAVLGSQSALMVQLCLLLLYLPIIVALAVIAGKAGENPLGILMPIYSEVVLLRIVRRPFWWLVILLAPNVTALALVLWNDPVPSTFSEPAAVLQIVGWVAWVAVLVGLVERFGKGTACFLGLVLVPFITLPVLAAGTYRPPGRSRFRGRRRRRG